MKKTFRMIVALLSVVCLLAAAVPMVLFPASAEAATTTVVYDFNGTDFRTTLRTSNLRTQATLITDGSAPEGYTGSVMGSARGSSSYAAGVLVDFGALIDTAKIVSIKVRMYVPSVADEKGSTLRVTGAAETTTVSYAEAAYTSGTWNGTYDTWCDIDLTNAVKNKIAKESDGTLTRFAIGYREKSDSTRVVYYDSLTVEYTGEFLQASTTYEYDFNGVDFNTTMTGMATHAALIADTSAVPTGFTGSVYGGVGGSYVSAGVDFAKLPNPNKIASVKVRMYVPSAASEGGSALRLYANDEATALVDTGIGYTTWGGTFDQWCEIDITSAVTATKALDEYGAIDRFCIAFREKSGSGRTIYFDSIIVEAYPGYEWDVPTPVTVTPASCYAADTTNNKDWRFHLKVDGTLPGAKNQTFGSGVVPVTIYDKDDNVLASSEAGTAAASYYQNSPYLMPYAHGTTNYTASNQPNEGDYIVFGAGMYKAKNPPAILHVENDIKLTYTNGVWELYQPVVNTTTTFDFNGTDFATTPFNGDIKTFGSLIADTSTVPAGFTGAVMGSSKGSSYSYASSVAVNFPLPLNPDVISKITVRMYVTEETGVDDYFRFFYGASDETQLTASSKKFGTMTGCAYNQWCDVDITSYVLDYAVGTDGYIDRFAIALRDYGTGERMVYYDSVTITYNGDLFVKPTAPTGDVYDFNDTDFSSPNTTFAENLTSTDHFATKVTDTSTVPAGFVGGVYGGVTSKYMAARVDFGDQALDLSKITSIRARIFIDYNPEDPSIRVFGNTGTYAQANLTKTIYDGWYECELLELLNSSAVTKNSDGTISEFVVSLRNGYTPRVFFDSIIIEGEDYLVSTAPAPEEVPDEVGGIEDGIFDFDGEAFTTPIKTNNNVTSANEFATKLTDTSSVPSGFAGGVYSVTDSSYTATWVDFNGFVDLSKVTSVRIRMYIPSYTYESNDASAKIRVFGTGGAYIENVYTAGYDRWVEVELLDILKNSNIDKRTDGKLEKFLFSIRTYGLATAYFDKIIIEGTDYYTPFDPSTFITVNELTLNESSSNKDVERSFWMVYLGTDLASLPGTAWNTAYTDVPVIVNDNTELTMMLKNGGGNNLFLADLKFTMVASETTYAKITVKAGEYYEQNGNGGLIVANDYTFYIYNDDLWRDPPPADFVVDITFEKMASPSSINGANWNMYVAPYGAVSVIGKSWTTKWADLVYEVDGEAYTAEMQRAEAKNGMFFQIPGTNLSPATESATVVIKAGTYACTTGDAPSVRVTEDYTFYVVNGAVYSEFNFDDPKFTETVIVDADGGSYTITDAETVTIDGVTYNQGDVYTTIGTHTLVYNKYNREYTRKVIIYRVGEVGDTAEIDVCDVVILERYLNSLITLTESAALGADLNGDGAINDADITLLRYRLLVINGMMTMAPANGATVMNPSDLLADFTDGYDPNVSLGDEFRTGKQEFHRDPAVLRWTPMEGAATYQVYVATKSNFSDALVFTTDKTVYNVLNLLPATTYYWKVKAGAVETAVSTFVTADTVRTLTIDGVDNARDIGGYTVGENQRIKYGTVFRTATLDNITEDGLYQMLTILGVKTDLDVRTPGEGTAGSGSPLGQNVNYLNYNAPYYWSKLVAAEYRDAFIGEIKAFTDASNYPIVVHCSVGRDRTGTLLFVIEGLCGMSKADLFMEYELSCLSAIGGGGTDPNLYTGNLMVQINKMYDNIQAYAPTASFADACAAFLMEEFDITQDEIDTIRELMIENVLEDVEPDPDPTPDPDPENPALKPDQEEDETEVIR